MKKNEILNKALELDTEQSIAVRELSEAIRKCNNLNVAIITAGSSMYAVDDKLIVDVEPSYDEYSVYEVDLKQQNCLPFIQHYELTNNDAEHCLINFDFKL